MGACDGACSHLAAGHGLEARTGGFPRLGLVWKHCKYATSVQAVCSN